MLIRSFLKALLISTVVAGMPAGAAHAQSEWPNKPIKYIVPFPPGGATDAISRPLVEKLQERLGQPVVIENIGGAGASIGVGRLRQSAPDGYTIGLGNSASHTITPHLISRVPYDPLVDFTPISMLTEYINVLVVPSSSPANNMKEFLALARSKPGGLTYGSAGNGSSNHLSAALLAQNAGLQFTHVPYKGSGAAMVDLLAGRIDWMFATISEVRPFLQDGRMRALGVSSRVADTMLPDVPPIAATVPGFEMVGFMGLFAPANLPAPVAARLSSEVQAILLMPEVMQRFVGLGIRPRSSTPEELRTRVTRDHAVWKSVINNAGIKTE